MSKEIKISCPKCQKVTENPERKRFSRSVCKHCGHLCDWQDEVLNWEEVQIKMEKIFYSKDDKCWIATDDEFPSISGTGETKIKAIADLRDILKFLETIKVERKAK